VKNRQGSGDGVLEGWCSLRATVRDLDATEKSHCRRGPEPGGSQNPQAKPYQMSSLSEVKNA